jgi:hypothetical protein
MGKSASESLRLSEPTLENIVWFRQLFPVTKESAYRTRGSQFDSTLWDDQDRLTGASRDSVIRAPEYSQAHGLRSGDVVRSEVGEFRRRVRIADMAAANLAVHWPEAKVLIRIGHYDPSRGKPDYSAVRGVFPASPAAGAGGTAFHGRVAGSAP